VSVNSFFIASSYRHYAIDFNKDGKVDLFSDPIDAIGSIANYFDKHQWHAAKFKVDDLEFNCAEQYMMYSKARKFRYFVIISRRNILINS
jgi:membrane-bound lytic murein transglycosylase B